MSITAERKSALINQYGLKVGDTGSPEVQGAILTERIANLTGHLKLTSRTTIPAAACSRWCRSGERSRQRQEAG